MENQDQKQKKKQAVQVGSLMFVGCMFIGMAAGYYFGNFKIGLFGGMGIGFIMMAVTKASMQNKS